MTTTQKKAVQKKTRLMEDDQPNTAVPIAAPVALEPANSPAPVVAAAQPAPVAAPVKTQPKLGGNALKLSEFVVVPYHAVVQAGVTVADVLHKTFFTHCAGKLKPGTEIKIEAEDGTFWAWLLVRSVVGTEVITELLLEKHFDAIEQGSIDAGDYTIVFAGSLDKWRVIRKSDNYKVSSGHATSIIALTWLTEHQKALAA